MSERDDGESTFPIRNPLLHVQSDDGKPEALKRARKEAAE